MEAEVLWDFTKTASTDSLSKTLWVDISCDNKNLDPKHKIYLGGTISGSTAYAGHMGHGHKISIDNVDREASKDEENFYYNLLCPNPTPATYATVVNQDEDYSNVTSNAEREVIDFQNSIPELEFKSMLTDQANVLTLDLRASLQKKLVDLQNQTGVQGVIATVSNLKGRSTNDYATELFKRWKLGSSDKKGDLNSVLLFIAPNEGKITVEAGSGLNMSDKFLHSVVDMMSGPDYSKGITKAVDLVSTDLIEAKSESEGK
jgi:hypothetical protein